MYYVIRILKLNVVLRATEKRVLFQAISERLSLLQFVEVQSRVKMVPDHIFNPKNIRLNFVSFFILLAKKALFTIDSVKLSASQL